LPNDFVIITSQRRETVEITLRYGEFFHDTSFYRSQVKRLPFVEEWLYARGVHHAELFHLSSNDSNEQEIKHMANQDHLDLLKQGKVAWNTWRQGHPHIRPDLRRARLRGVHLEGTDLNEANFLEADLGGANFTGATLVRANLSGADLTMACFRDADLQDANLSLADMRLATLDGTNLNGANLTGTKK